jgi:hypothetical protein
MRLPSVAKTVTDGELHHLNLISIPKLAAVYTDNMGFLFTLVVTAVKSANLPLPFIATIFCSYS